MISTASQQARLIEVHSEGPIAPEDRNGMRSALGLLVRIAVSVLFAADVRTCERLDPDVLPMVVGLKRGDNRSPLRSGVLSARGARSRCSSTALGAPMKGARKACFGMAKLIQWLREVASPAGAGAGAHPHRRAFVA